MPAARRSRPPLAAALAVAALALVLCGCAERPDQPAGLGALTPARAVDNQEHPAPPSATLPLRGASHREGGFSPGFSPAPAAGGKPTTGSFDAPGTPSRAPGFEVGGLPARMTAPGRATPVRLAVPAIGVATRLVRLGLEPGGGMQVPEDYGRAGWYAGGPAPGQVGPAVIAGHLDSRTGPAVFHRLRELRPGDAVVVERADGARLRFLVERSRSYPKAGFPTAEVFGPVPAAALRLVTCGGAFDQTAGGYRDNLVVFARLAAVDR